MTVEFSFIKAIITGHTGESFTLQVFFYNLFDSASVFLNF